MVRSVLAGVLVVVLSAAHAFHAQTADVGPFTFNTMAYGRIPAVLQFPTGLVIDSADNVIVSQILPITTIGNVVRISAQGVMSFPTNLTDDPVGIGVDSTGNVYVARPILGLGKLAPGSNQFTAYNPESIALSPTDVTVAPGPTVYMSSRTGVYVVPATGNPVLVAGGDGSFTHISGIAVGGDGAIYISDRGNHTIRKLAGGVVTTLAGTAGISGSADGTGSAAAFFQPGGLSAASDGTIFVADRGITPSARSPQPASSPRWPEHRVCRERPTAPAQPPASTTRPMWRSTVPVICL